MSAEMIYRFKEAAHLPSSLDPQAVGERLARLREAGGEGFTPESVVDDARPEDSPLHDAFTWDDSEAAERYRIQEAGHLIRSVVLVYRESEEDREVRAFLPVVTRTAEESEYLSTVDVISDEEYRRQYVERMLGELVAIRRKGREFDEFARVWRAIDRTSKELRAA